MPDAGPNPPQLQRFYELKGLVSLYEKVFEKQLPPDTTFERRSGEIRACIDETWAKLSTAQPEDVPNFQEKIVELSGSLKEIELSHNRQKERYEARLWKHYNALRDSVMKVLVERPEATPAAEPGQVYLAFWESSKQWVPILLLPMTNLERVGVSGSLDSLDLAEILPICYDQDSLTGERTWRDGYKDGQTLVTEREFPVIYFEGRAFPDKSPVGWVAAKDLRRFDVTTATSDLVPQIQMVRKFLKERAANASCDGVEETSHDKDVSDGMSDELPWPYLNRAPQETSTVLNQDEQPIQSPHAPETVEAPEASTNGSMPTSGPTPKSQPAPGTSATSEKSQPDAATEAGPKEQPTGDTQSKPTKSQSLSRQKTPLRKAVLVMADLTPSPDATPVSESERPQDTITAMELDPRPQASADNAKPAPEAVMALDERAPTDEVPGHTIKVEPNLDIPRNIDIPRDIEIISIASTEPEEEEEDDGAPELEGLPGPSKQPGVVEEGRAKEGQQSHHEKSQSKVQTESLPGKPGPDSCKAIKAAGSFEQSRWSGSSTTKWTGT
ncbi:hypothetical protein Neosp_012682 [[Neocosmospora] mangrovei]